MPNFLNCPFIKRIIQEAGPFFLIVQQAYARPFAEHRKMADEFDSLGLFHKLVTAPDAGPWFPQDFQETLDKALSFVLGYSVRF